MGWKVSRRRCSQCGEYFETRLPGSGLKASICSVACERLEQQQKASRAAAHKQDRHAETRRFGQPVDRGDQTRKGWTARVLELYGSECLSCGAQAVQGHHVTPRHAIMAAHHLRPSERSLLEYDATNGFSTCLRCHERHEAGVERYYFRMIPSPAVEWADLHGFGSRVFNPTVYLGAPNHYGEKAA